MGRIYTLLVVKVSMQMLVNRWSYNTHGNELYQIQRAPHSINPSLVNLLDVCLYMGRIYAFLVKYQLDGFFFTL